MRANHAVFLLLAFAILSGCAGPKLTAKGAPLVEEKELNFLHTPVESLGVMETENLRRGKTCTVAGWFPERAFSEEYPGRVSWKAWAANLETGREFFAQSVRSGIYRDGKFAQYFMLDDDSIEAMESRGVMLSSDLSFVAELGEDTRIYPLDARLWREKKEYRLAVVKRYGTPLRGLKKVRGFEEAVLGWSLHEIKGIGGIRMPYGDEEISKINAINPAYSLLEKIALKGNLTVYLDPVATASNVALNIILASGVKSEAWDYNSNLPNRPVMGSIIEFVGKFRLELIRKLNEENKLARRE